MTIIVLVAAMVAMAWAGLDGVAWTLACLLAGMFFALHPRSRPAPSNDPALANGLLVVAILFGLLSIAIGGLE